MPGSAQTDEYFTCLQAQLSSQLGSMGQSLGSLPLSSLGSILGQPVSRMSSYGPQHSASQDSSSRRISFESLSQFSPGTHSAASSSSRNRGLTEQQVCCLPIAHPERASCEFFRTAFLLTDMLITLAITHPASLQNADVIMEAACHVHVSRHCDRIVSAILARVSGIEQHLRRTDQM